MRLLLLLAMAPLLVACRGGGLSTALARVDSASPGSGISGSTVSLTPQDLAPVDAYISHEKNAQWILGDDVEVVASREYFWQVLTANSRIGLVERRDDESPRETLVTLVYRGSKFQRAVQNNPRVMIGTGLTVSARNVLRVHLVKTRDPQVPVRLEVTATGDASRGRGEKVEQRGQVLTLGGFLRKSADGYRWQVLGV